jgi:hypothetical protein
MAKTNNTKRPQIIFLYEGDTEREFYDLIFKTKLPKGTRMHFVHLQGFIKTHNKGVRHELDKFLWNHKYLGEQYIHVFIAYDREGPVETELRIYVDLLRRDFQDQPRIKSINEIIATQDLESWLFLDIDGIYTYLRTKKSLRVPHKYKNHQSFTNRDLSALFYQHGKDYQKGINASEFIAHLDLEKIYKNCPELQEGIKLLISKCT